MLKTKMISLMMMLFFLASCASFSESRFGFRRGMEDSEVQEFVSRIRPSQAMLANDYKYACFLKDRQKYQLAIEEFEKILAVDPAHVQSLNAAGICYDRLGDYDKGISCYKKAIELTFRSN
jgi:tetratricopeptide (TPR) repeat protein